jgi:hypothetical protein
MANQLDIYDQSTDGPPSRSITLEFLTDQITVEELIRSRVYQEVKDFNTRKPEQYNGLIRPAFIEAALQSGNPIQHEHVDFEAQFDKAIEAFGAKKILILVDDQQVESLADEIVVMPETSIVFLRLVPLVGG